LPWLGLESPREILPFAGGYATLSQLCAVPPHKHSANSVMAKLCQT
jgi:hypothetical protein